MAEFPPHCTRCGRSTPPDDSDDVLEWETDGEGNAWTCPGCLTGTEEQAVAEDAMALGDAMKSAGLSGDDIDVETMPDDEFEMRESLAMVIYENEPGAFRRPDE